MSMNDQTRWDRQHALQGGAERPAIFLQEIFASQSWEIPAGPALDIATGKGRNALFLAERGFTVTGIDVSPLALQEARRNAEKKSLEISWQHADLEQIQLAPATYDLIVNINYLQRSLFSQIRESLKIGGHIIFETYLIEQQAIGHPKNPAYLLAHNELLERFAGYRVLCYREGKYTESGRPAFRSGLFAQKTAA